MQDTPVSFSRDTTYSFLGLLTGLFAHHAFFIHGEWHVYAPEIFLFHFIPFSLIFTIKACSGGSDLGKTSEILALMSYYYISALTASIILYRVFFHRLTKAGFRGPWYARITKLWHVWAARNSRGYLVLEELRKEYGDFVRTGPAELTVFHPDVFNAIDGPRSQCIKAEWYDILHPSLALVTARDKSIHGARRREWNQGFTTNALAEHGAKVLKHINELDECIESDVKSNRPSEMRDLMFWFGFDVMGGFVFNKSFGMLRNKEWHNIVIRLQHALSLLGPFSPAPWLIQLAFRIPSYLRVWAIKDWFDMVAWCKDQMQKRLDDGYAKQPSPDLTHYLMEQGQVIDQDKLLWLNGDSLLAIVAGSEPTAVALICALCQLTKHPEHIDRIYEELIDIDIKDIKSLSPLAHLNAVINETLRLSPALLTGGARKTTENGIWIGETFIPPYTTIIAPRYSIFRREDCFEQATGFIPERWSTRPEMIRKATGFTPFGTGHHSCIGRPLAVDIMRYVIARLVKKYRFRFGPHENGKRVFDDMYDQFTTNPGKLTLLFELRE